MEGAVVPAKQTVIAFTLGIALTCGAFWMWSVYWVSEDVYASREQCAESRLETIRRLKLKSDYADRVKCLPVGVQPTSR
jgi:hypothetical protein